MGNRIGKLCPCSAGASSGDISGRLENSIVFNSSICYVRPNYVTSFSDDDVTLMTFRSVSGATVSANSSSTPSTSLDDSLQHSTVLDSSASFESSGSFTSSTMVVPLMQHQHHHVHAPCGFSVGSNIERGLSWGPIVGLQSPCDRVLNDGCSTEKGPEPMKKLRRSLKKVLSRVLFRTLSLGERPILKKNDNANNARVSCSSTSLSGELRLHHGVEGGDDNNYFDDDGDGGGGGGGVCDLLMGCQNLHWAQGRAGEDRVHIVICENHGWVFVGIYDGFNGPDATDYLLNNMFYAVYDELKWLLCSTSTTTPDMAKSSLLLDSDSMELKEKVLSSFKENGVVDGETENYPIGNEKLNLDCVSERVEGINRRNSNEEEGMMWECEGGGEKLDIEKREQAESDSAAFSHSDVLQALSEALRKTEDAFLKTSDEMIHHNPVLAMMGSCVLVMLMKGEDVYLMNVGDSRAVLATQAGNSLQLTTEHSTHVKEEVYRIRREHPDDPFAVTKGRVKGCLNVTRAFGAGFLKQPKQNNAVLETFKVSYIGESPYITCSPSLHPHRLSPNDKFLILSSDGLFQYFTNEEAVAKVESFITMFPDRDPAQLLIEEALSRAAKKAGLEFHELLDIPQGERRLYHDDISIVIISLEGKIWRSLV